MPARAIKRVSTNQVIIFRLASKRILQDGRLAFMGAFRDRMHDWKMLLKAF
jgi:hypothetical protein